MLLHLLTSSSLTPACSSPRRRTGAAEAAAMVRCASSSTRSPSSSAAEAGLQVVKVHSYGTVDYERRTALRWSSLYRRIAVGHGDLPVGRTLGAWDEGERRLDRWELYRIARELYRIARELRKFRRFNVALQLRPGCSRPLKESCYSNEVPL